MEKGAKKGKDFKTIPTLKASCQKHAATYASRSSTPLEIVSKVLLRHANLSTTKEVNCIPTRF
jgi:hypothetical protein